MCCNSCCPFVWGGIGITGGNRCCGCGCGGSVSGATDNNSCNSCNSCNACGRCNCRSECSSCCG